MRNKEFNLGFTQTSGEPNLYRKSWLINSVKQEIFVGQYVDDCLVAASSQQALVWFTDHLKQRFPVNPASSGAITVDNPGLLLSMQVRYDKKGGVLQFDQKRAIEALAEKLNVNKAADAMSLPISSSVQLPKLSKAEVSSTDYLSIIGSCLHICQVSRPDSAYAVGVLSRHSATPGV